MYETDQEQIEAIKSWWSQNANWVVGGFILFILAYFGYHWYQNSMEKHQLAASDLYEQLVKLPATDTDGRTKIINELKADYSDLTYSSLAALFAAKAAVEGSDYSTALTEIDWAEQHADKELLPVILYRKALVLYAQNDLDGAMAALDAIKGDGHQAVTHELKGDILLAQGKTNEARLSYQQALDESAKEGINNPFLKIKVDDLAQSAG